ncbi:MAG: site-2 protease family protein, partial [Candidatus Saccharimonadales bacterium]
MGIVIMVGQLLLGLSILVILHEFGHFIAARAFGIKVEKFYLFFDAWGVSLFKFNYKGVEYGIGWLPLGGYVKIAGMIDESMDTEQLAGPPQPWEFRSKPAWQRLIVMLAGITVNIILGIFIFWVLTIKYGETYIPNSEAKYGIV